MRAQGCNVAELAEEIGAGEATVYEVIRALREIDAIEKVERGRYRFAPAPPVAKALRSLVVASRDLADTPVSRPPGRVKGQ
jgi:DNA-binding IclR family transcriptional regulator